MIMGDYNAQYEAYLISGKVCVCQCNDHLQIYKQTQYFTHYCFIFIFLQSNSEVLQGRRRKKICEPDKFVEYWGQNTILSFYLFILPISSFMI